MSTAQELIQRVIARTGAADRPIAVDRIATGDPAQLVTGIAVMTQATLEGLQQAAAAKANLIFSYDPVFWTSGDDLARLEMDALYLEKRDFIRNKMVVFGLHDHLHDAHPDMIATGMAQALGWSADSSDANLFRRPSTTLLALAQELSSKLNDQTLRGLVIRACRFPPSPPASAIRRK